MRFGILSTAGIARSAVVPAIQQSDHEAVAVASRDGDAAAAFAAEFDVERAYGGYEALLEDDAVDAVYNPLPNALHAEWTRRAADHGKHVLCEKPLGVDAAEAREMGEHCEDAGVTLMEAFMYRYHPRTERAAELVAELGDVRSVKAAFQFPLFGDPGNVRLDPDLAGGSLMDVGCYAVNAARLFAGEPVEAYAHTVDTKDSGVDTHLAGVLAFEGGATATVTSGFDTAKTQTYRVETADGYLETEAAFDTSGAAGTTLDYAAGERTVTESFAPADAYLREVRHFAECVEGDRTPRTDAEEAARNMAVIDALYASADRGEPVAV